MKSFHKFYRSHSNELEKFEATLSELRSLVRIQVPVEHILLNYIYISDMCVIVLILFFHCKLFYLLRAHFVILFFARV